jgi:Domain of unknown function (DUF3854)/Family of unknown function (DUF5906)
MKLGQHTDTEKIARIKLAESGLTPSHATQFGIQILSVTDTSTQITNKHKQASLRIQYYNFQGKEVRHTRYRYIGEPSGFLANLSAHKYDQSHGSGNHLYIPIRKDWKEILSNPQKYPIFFTEGELKTLALTVLAHVPALGISGVDCWRTRVNGVSAPLPEFEQIDFKERRAFIVFDDDAQRNPNVWRAQQEFGNYLFTLGAEVYVVKLPSLYKDKKTGVDDYLVAQGADAFLELVTPPKRGELSNPNLINLKEESVFIKINSESAWITEMKCFYRFDTGKFYSGSEMGDHYANIFHTRVKSNGKMERVPGFKYWNTHPLRSELRCISYCPGEPPFPKKDVYNCWRPPDYEPMPGDVEPFKQLLYYLRTDNPEMDAELLNRLSWMLRWPGRKMQSMTILIGAPGVGKSLLFSIILRRLVGSSNFYELTDQTFERFNAGLERCVVAYSDEYGDLNVNKDIARRTALKAFVTSDTLPIERKGRDLTVEPVHFNICACTNTPSQLRIESDDRRTCVIQVITTDEEARQAKKELTGIAQWSLRQENIAHIAHYLLTRKDYPDDYDPRDFVHIPCQLRAELKFEGVDPIVTMLRLFLNNPEAYTGSPQIRIATCQQVLGFICGHDQLDINRYDVRKVGKSLSDPLLLGKVWRLNDGKELKIGKEVLRLVTWDPTLKDISNDDIRALYAKTFPAAARKF